MVVELVVKMEVKLLVELAVNLVVDGWDGSEVGGCGDSSGESWEGWGVSDGLAGQPSPSTNP